MRGIRNRYLKPVRPKKPFTRRDIIKFMTMARTGSLMDWRAAFPLALCFQQLLCGAECFDLNGSNIARHDGFFRVVVESSKNHVEGLEFDIPISPEREFCVGSFMGDYIRMTGIRLGDPSSFFLCKLVKSRGKVWLAGLAFRVVDSTMRAA
jgi:hypothetical protein